MTHEERREIVLAPLIVWAGLFVLLGLTWGYAYIPGASAKVIVSLTIALAKGALIVAFFMQLRRADGLTRLAALAGIVWASFLFLFTFADFLTR
ncbi:cytochrome C oxidase subunit IV family protein [Novosphingobium profundi]|uniref:cytochrome C oxidase subunit IV family protein n=1 Tax=Novosphingobium profundi TaxID=1774954 RepID=UPI001BDB0279|nr:cytochrome C oxidase subunit IV family protein [Novosphingobium profundi]MBT0667618.1 cytochrome C oxidase subunit IV family protein [Novosphingobium profundi]